MKNVLIDKTVLIVGAGNVGEACAFRLIDHKVKKIILHTLTEKEANEVLVRVKKYANEDSSTALEISWGDVLLPEKLAYKNKKEILQSEEDSNVLLSYYFDPLSEETIKTSFLYHLMEKFKPDVIIDAVNTATVVGYADDPYSLPRRIIKDSSVLKNNATELLLSNSINPLIRFTQVLEKIMTKFNLDCYVKVSTTGLGGMGINLPYTHGDLNEPGMSSGILGKVAAAGVMHQLFWSLSHTPGCNIKVIVPAALIGWQHIDLGDFRSHGDKLREVLIPQKQEISSNLILKEAVFSDETIKIPYVDSGENNAYSLHEMMAITSLGQMEAVTREEVSEAVIQSILGSTKNDVLTALDHATLNPSYTAAIQRDHVFGVMKDLEHVSEYPSIATNNLGPTMSKHLFELYVLLKVANNSLETLINDLSVSDIMDKITNLLKEDKKIIKYALSLRLPLINPQEELFILDNTFVPEDKNLLKNTSQESLEKFIEEGWVDFRPQTIHNWLKKLTKLYKEKNTFINKMSIPLERNWQNIHGSDIGEILGYIYSMSGGNRRKELSYDKRCG